ncbi:MAG: hypothetical protein PHE18_01590 [Candidatus Omnitrophica bacterium]|nr:hypothetical protein [Candidatus Omnitrophota bacterium]
MTRGQSINEYSLCLAIILIAFLGVNIYVKRGLQGRYRDMVDETTNAISAQTQYEPYYAKTTTTVNMARTVDMTTSEIVDGKVVNPGKVSKNISGDPTTVKNIDAEAAGMVGSELEPGSKIIKVQ